MRILLAVLCAWTAIAQDGGVPTVAGAPGPPPTDINGNALGPSERVTVTASDGGPVDGLVVTPLPGSVCVIDFFRKGYITYRNPGVGHNIVCLVSIQMPGFRSVVRSLTDGLKIPMQRLGEREGSTISITSLNVPHGARAAHEKGLLALRQGKWSVAQQRFEDAVRLYPKHAVAWSELGAVLERLSRVDEARTAYLRAESVDPKYVKPLAQLARLEAERGDWDAVVDVFERAVRLNPVEFPGLYYYHAAALFNRRLMLDAEKNARQCTELDTRNEYPRAWLLLGRALAGQRDVAGAAGAFREYLRRSPRAAEAAEIEGWLRSH